MCIEIIPILPVKIPSLPYLVSLLATIFVFLDTLSGSTLAINWGGNYVSTTTNWADHVPANISGSDAYGDPHGPFVIDADGDGADDSIVGRALDTTTPFSPSSGYFIDRARRISSSSGQSPECLYNGGED